MKYLMLVLVLMSGCGRDGKNGLDGSNGVNGSDGVSPTIEVIVPCPALAGAYPEVLWRLNSKLYAVYSSGAKIHLTELPPGSYTTTDGRSCSFMITADNAVL